MVPATAVVRCIGGIICSIEAVCCFGGNIRGVIDVSLFIFIIIIIIIIVITETIGVKVAIAWNDIKC